MARERKEEAISVRLTPTGAQLWNKIADKWGQSKTAVLERLLREAAEREGVKVNAPTEEATT